MARMHCGGKMDENRYCELKYLARQYDSLHRILPDQARMQRNAHKVAQIEAAARAASDDLYPWVMEAVTKGKTFEQMQVPCGRSQFHKVRELFFKTLDTLIE